MVFACHQSATAPGYAAVTTVQASVEVAPQQPAMPLAAAVMVPDSAKPYM